MRHVPRILLTFACLATQAEAAGWSRLIDPGEGTNDKAQRLLALPDGSFVVLAEHDGTTYRLTRLDAKGRPGKSTGLPGTIDDAHASTIIATADGGFAGGSQGPRLTRYDKALARTVKRYEPFQTREDGDFLLAFLAEGPDGGLIGLAQSQKALVRVSIDKTGNLTAQPKSLGSFNRLSGLGGTALLKDGGLVITGDTEAAKDDLRDLRAVKLDLTGKVVWDVSYGGPKKDYGATAAGTADGGVLLGGGTTSTGAGGLDWYVVKLDKDGKKLWEKTYGTPSNDFIARVAELPKGGYLAGGNFGPVPTLIKLGEDGAVVWQKSYLKGYLTDLAPLPDGGVAGLIMVRPEGLKRLLMVVFRTDASGDAGPAPKIPKAPKGVTPLKVKDGKPGPGATAPSPHHG